MTATATPLTTAEVAEAMGTDPRTLRKFLRADAVDRNVATPGKGSRYALPSDKRSIEALGKRFAKWEESRKAEKAPKTDAADNTPETPDGE